MTYYGDEAFPALSDGSGNGAGEAHDRGDGCQSAGRQDGGQVKAGE